MYMLHVNITNQNVQQCTYWVAPCWEANDFNNTKHVLDVHASNTLMSVHLSHIRTPCPHKKVPLNSWQ